MTAPLTTLRRGQTAFPSIVSEKDWQKQVIDLAHVLGWKVAHFRPAMTKHGWRTPVSADGAGFPDLVLVHAGQRRLIFAELKSDKGRLRTDQKEWLEWLGAVAEMCEQVDACVWRPGEFEVVYDALRPGLS